jgi:hypothetical protein
MDRDEKQRKEAAEYVDSNTIAILDYCLKKGISKKDSAKAAVLPIDFADFVWFLEKTQDIDETISWIKNWLAKIERNRVESCWKNDK